jgi:hypothetical protein
MPWYQLDDANDPKLDELARQYNLHPLHIEDARSADESVKVDTAPKVMSSRCSRAAILSLGSLRMTRLLVRLVKVKIFLPVKKLVWFGSCFSLTPGSEPRRDERVAINFESAIVQSPLCSEVRGVR